MQKKCREGARKPLLSFAAGSIVFLIGALCPVLAAEAGKSLELNRALVDIKTAEQMINQRTALAEEVQRGLTQQVDDLKAEIHLERRRANVASFLQARQISRIDYNLRLIQHLLGYIDRLDNRLAFFRSAIHTLEFYRRQIRDDMLILRTLNDVETTGLMRQLAAELDRFKEQAGKPLLTGSSQGLRPLEAIWSDVLRF